MRREADRVVAYFRTETSSLPASQFITEENRHMFLQPLFHEGLLFVSNYKRGSPMLKAYFTFRIILEFTFKGE